MGSSDVIMVFLIALGTALATGLGAIPMLVTGTAGPRALGVANAAASGVMSGASVSLVLDGADRSLREVARSAPSPAWSSS